MHIPDAAFDAFEAEHPDYKLVGMHEGEALYQPTEPCAYGEAERVAFLAADGSVRWEQHIRQFVPDGATDEGGEA